MHTTAMTPAVILLLYVDGVKITGMSISLILELKQQLHHKFVMTNLGPIWRFLGVEYSTSTVGLLLHQTSYAHNLLTQF